MVNVPDLNLHRTTEQQEAILTFVPNISYPLTSLHIKCVLYLFFIILFFFFSSLKVKPLV